MGQLAIVNAPVSFTFIWSIIKPWLSKETVEKVNILGSDYQDVLLGLVDKENLPASLGGRCECEGGCEYSFAGPWKENLKERRERRQREASQDTERTLAVNGVPSVERTEEEKQVPVATPTGTQEIVATKEHIGNSEVVVP
jgi:hypothetical protein